MSTKVKAIRYFQPVFECASDRLADSRCRATHEEITELWLRMIDAAAKGDDECRQFLPPFSTWASEVIQLGSH